MPTVFRVWVRGTLLRASPLVGLLLFFHGMLLAGEESLPLSLIIEREIVAGTSTTLFSRAIVPEEMQRYRILNLQARRPSILALGSSTSMQLRDFHFGPYANEFYNAGGLVQDIEQLDDAATVVADAGCRTVIVGLDSWWFNPNWRSPLPGGLAVVTENLGWRQDLVALQQAHWRFAKLLIRSPVPTLDALGRLGNFESPVAGERAYGLTARGGNGFRGRDGSRQYAHHIDRLRTGAAFTDGSHVPARIRGNRAQFVAADGVDASSLARLVHFLDESRDLGVLVSAYLPALSEQSLSEVQSSPGHQAYFEAYRRELRDLFEERDLPFVDAIDVRASGLDDRYMVDGFHGSEGHMAHILTRLLAHPKLARRLLDLSPDVPAGFAARPAEMPPTVP